MIVEQLLNPKSIVVVGASNDETKPGGKVLKNLLTGGIKGEIIAVNPKENIVQGIKCHNSLSDVHSDLAILAIASKFALPTIKELISNGTKAFIILSAGFSEIGEEGRMLEKEIVNVINQANGSLIGPNCIGVMNTHYKGVFAGPLPKLDSSGIDFVSGSGATAVFILEAAIPMGLTFSSVFSVGNSAQIGVEEVLEYWDDSFDPETSSKIKMIYLETINNPLKLLKHSSSLINKGCRIAAIKAGATQSGARAASSHTGALAGSDDAVSALFKKSGIVRCFSKEELLYTAGVFAHKPLTGKRIAVVTHAGGPGVMLTDALEKNGMEVPHIEGTAAEELLAKLYHGSSVSNPIDFLATGNAEQLGEILDYTDTKFHNIDASVVIFGTPGLFDVKPVYQVLHEKMNTSKKPIFPVLPSIVQVKEAVDYFISLGRVNFMEEVNLAGALAKSWHTPKPAYIEPLPEIDSKTIRETIFNADNGYLKPDESRALLMAVNIGIVPEKVVFTKDDALSTADDIGYKIAMKVVGPIHKTDVGGVRLNVDSPEVTAEVYEEMMRIKGAEAVLIQKMIPPGIELFLGAKKEDKYGHLVLCGLGGLFVEVLKDVSTGLAPINKEEALSMIRSLRSYQIIKGIRGQKGANEEKFAEIMTRLSALLMAAPEIAELDMNPLIASEDSIIAVDYRIRIEKK